MAKDIAKTISSFQLINLDITLDLKSMTNQIIDNLSSTWARLFVLELNIFHVRAMN